MGEEQRLPGEMGVEVCGIILQAMGYLFMPKVYCFPFASGNLFVSAYCLCKLVSSLACLPKNFLLISEAADESLDLDLGLYLPQVPQVPQFIRHRILSTITSLHPEVILPLITFEVLFKKDVISMCSLCITVDLLPTWERDGDIVGCPAGDGINVKEGRRSISTWTSM